MRDGVSLSLHSIWFGFLGGGELIQHSRNFEDDQQEDEEDNYDNDDDDGDDNSQPP